MTNKQTNKQTAFWRISSLLFLIPVLMIFTFSCNKDKNMEMESDSIKAELRSSHKLNITELKDFQASLRDIRDEVATNTSYTIEEAVYGIETLINIRYSEYSADYDTRYFRDTFFYDSNSENYYDLLLKAKSAVENHTSENHIVGMNLEEIKNENGNRLFYATTITSGGNPLRDGPIGDDCEDVVYYSMYMGSHHLDMETGEIVLTKHSCDRDPECGDIGLPDGKLAEPVASSEIGRQLTKRKAKPIEDYCQGETWNSHSLKHKFIDFKGIGVVSYNFEEMKVLNDCYRSLSGEVTACDCLSPHQINDMYNLFNKKIDEVFENYIQYAFPNHVLTSVLTWGRSEPEDGASGNVNSNVRVECAIVIARPLCLFVDSEYDLLEMDFYN